MSTIFPGNYVAHLNAYRDQGVLAVPGVEYYQLRGIAIITANQTGGGTLALEILSPDLRQDDKPRQDKPFKVPAGATVYRTAIRTTNLSASGTDTVSVAGLTTTTNTLASLAAVAGKFAADGASTSYSTGAVSTESSEITISAAYSGALSIIDSSDCAAVMVEVCFFLDAPGPDVDDYSIPYKTEAGSGY